MTRAEQYDQQADWFDRHGNPAAAEASRRAALRERGEPVWVDYVPRPKAPTPILAFVRATDLMALKLSAARGSASLPAELHRFGEREMRRLGLAAPPAQPNPLNPSGLIFSGGTGGSAFDLATFPTYP